MNWPMPLPAGVEALGYEVELDTAVVASSI
jgi:hypothetical protein